MLVSEFPESIDQITPHNEPKIMTALVMFDIPEVVF